MNDNRSKADNQVWPPNGERAKNEKKIEQHWRDSQAKRYGEQNEFLNRAWAAGLFDGEGNVSGQQGTGIHCSIDQTVTGRKESHDRSVEGSTIGYLNLVRFMEAVGGVGTISFLSPRKKGNAQPACRWAVTSQVDVQKVFNAIGQFLSGAKRDQFASVLTIPFETAMRHDLPLPDGSIEVEVPSRRKSGHED